MTLHELFMQIICCQNNIYDPTIKLQLRWLVNNSCKVIQSNGCDLKNKFNVSRLLTSFNERSTIYSPFYMILHNLFLRRIWLIFFLSFFSKHVPCMGFRCFVNLFYMADRRSLIDHCTRAGRPEFCEKAPLSQFFVRDNSLVIS